MKFWTLAKPKNTRFIASHEPDLFQPARNLTSPVSIERLKAFVIEAEPKITAKILLRHLLTEFLALGSIAAVAYTTLRAPVITSEKHLRTFAVAQRLQPSMPVLASSMPHVGGRTYMTTGTAVHIFNLAGKEPGLLPVAMVKEAPAVAAAQSQNYRSLRAGESLAPINPNVTLFATASAGAYFDHLRMLVENVSVGINDDWRYYAVGFRSTRGTHDIQDFAAHHPDASTIPWKRNDEELYASIGARLFVSDFEIRLGAGPSYFTSSVTSVAAASGNVQAPSVARLFGIATEGSISYTIASHLQTTAGAFVGYYGQSTITSGVSIGLMVTP